MASRKRIFLIDGSHAMFRSYHAIRTLATSRGLPTNATFGFIQIVQKIIKDYDPEYLVVVFDLPGPTFRHKIFPEYKANRPPMPEDLVEQIPWIKKALEAYRIPQIQQQGYEGDDLMGTLARMADKKGLDTVIVTGDKDLCQLATDRIRILEPRKDLLMGPKEVADQFGVTAVQLPDLLALTGDKVDNLPGIPGVGPKTAARLLQSFGSLEEIFKRADEIEKPKLRALVEEHKDQVRKTRELVEIFLEVPVEGDLEDFQRKTPDTDSLRELFRELEFQRLLDNLPAEKQLSDEKYTTVLDEKALGDLVDTLSKSKNGFAFDLETTSVIPMLAEPVGLSFAVEGDSAWYVPVGHNALGAPKQIPLETVLERVRPVLENPALPKFGQNIKYDMLIMKKQGCDVKGVAFDTMIASYLLDPSRRGHRLDDLSQEHLNHKMISYEEVAGPKGAGQQTFDKVDVDKASVYSCEDAHATYLLTRVLEKKIREEGFGKLFHEVEMPLVEVLTHMEFAGIRIDEGFFGSLSTEFRERLSGLEREIHEAAGTPFNINSPKQLGKILFDELKLPNPKKTKTGYATDVKELWRLADEHPLPKLVLGYRSLSKLLSTYVDALPRMVNPVTGRIHTSFNQSVTATGRLSSSDPNLQNIPIRTTEGRKIRKGFIPAEGMWLLSADYSQIELRILAHVSGDERLKEAFQKDQDVHAHTAGILFGCEPELVSDDMRRRAKVINFGVIYGMGPYGLAGQLGISQGEARTFIDHYFETYSGVKAWQEACLEEARRNGYVSTLLNRKRPLPEITSRNGSIRAMAERTAINTPIQGTAADMIKVAMIQVFHRLLGEGFRSRMLLQVHDELVFEVPEDEREAIRPIIRKEMEEVMPLDVAMKVDMEEGKNWSEAH